MRTQVDKRVELSKTVTDKAFLPSRISGLWRLCQSRLTCIPTRRLHIQGAPCRDVSEM